MTKLNTPTPLPIIHWDVGIIDASVQAGFPSPADEHLVERTELMGNLVKHPQATYLLRVQGESMGGVGFFDGDVLLVDKAIEFKHGQIVIAVVNGDFVCKTLYQCAGVTKLRPVNVTYPDIISKSGETLEIWGVVIATIKQFRT